MRTSELTGAPLDYWVAKAEGEIVEVIHGYCVRPMAQYHDEIQYEMYAPSTDWAQGGPLIEKYGLTVEPYPPAWWANEPDTRAIMGTGPLEAICRAVVAAKFGDEVPDEIGGA